MTLAHRSAMCRLACMKSDFVDTCEWGWASSSHVARAIQRVISKHFTVAHRASLFTPPKPATFSKSSLSVPGVYDDSKALGPPCSFDNTFLLDSLECLRARFPGLKVQFEVLEMCGADHAAKYRQWMRKPMVCLPRTGYTELVRAGMAQSSFAADKFCLVNAMDAKTAPNEFRLSLPYLG